MIQKIGKFATHSIFLRGEGVKGLWKPRRDPFQILLRTFSKLITFYSTWNYQQIINHNFRGRQSQLICLNPLNIRSELWRRSLSKRKHVWKVSVFRVFLVRIFLDSDWIRRDAEYFSIFSPNTGKYGPKKLQIRTLFTRWNKQMITKIPSFKLNAT